MAIWSWKSKWYVESSSDLIFELPMFFHHSHFVPKSGVPYLINMLIISMLSFCFEFNIHTLTFRKRIQQLFWVERPQSIVYILQKNPFQIGWSFLEIVQKMNVKKLKSFFFCTSKSSLWFFVFEKTNFRQAMKERFFFLLVIVFKNWYLLESSIPIIVAHLYTRYRHIVLFVELWANFELR